MSAPATPTRVKTGKLAKMTGRLKERLIDRLKGKRVRVERSGTLAKTIDRLKEKLHRRREKRRLRVSGTPAKMTERLKERRIDRLN